MTWDDCYREDSFRINGTKTETSDRWLPMFPEIKKLFDSIPRKGKFMFPFQYAIFRKHFNAIRERLIIKNITLKDLRHTFGTRCLESGVNIKTVSKWLGHSNIQTTERIYLHITQAFEREEIARFSEQLKMLKKGVI
jgi:integrase